MIFFRADGNSELGTGHVMRCLSLAKALQKQGEQCVFVAADECMKAVIISNGFQFICLNSRWDDLMPELLELIELIKWHMPSLLILDSYYVTQNYMTCLKEIVKVAYIDDLNLFDYPCDFLINYNIYGDELGYKNLDGRSMMIGCQYAPLREEFARNGLRKVKDRVTDVLITVGGSDPSNISQALLEALGSDKNLNGLRFHLVVGRLNQHAMQLNSMAKQEQRIIIHQDVSNMAELMHSCDISISAAGSTLYELCACGTPAISFAFADNQLPGTKSFAKVGVIPTAGDWRRNKHGVVMNIQMFLLNMMEQKNTRQVMASKMQNLVDGTGAIRLAEELVKQ